MQHVSDDYIEAAGQYTRQTSSKLVLNGEEYTDELISHPMISIENDTLIGGFPAKKVTFEMYKTDALQLADKEFFVYRGLYIGDTIEYVLQGIFKAKAEDIITSNDGNKISVTGYDRALQLDVAQKSLPVLTNSFTYGDFVEFILSDTDVVLSDDEFPLKNIIMKSLPNVSENISKRILLSKLAEINGAICIINREGDLSFVRQQASNNVIISNYNKFKIGEDFGIINQISVSTQEGINDSVIYPENIDTPVLYRIFDNPFCNPNQNEIIELIAPNIIGLITGNYILENIIDDYVIDLNDLITVNARDCNTYNLPVLSYVSTGRIKADIKSEIVQEETSQLENSLSDRITNAEININKQDALIQLKVSKGDLISEINQTEEKIELRAGHFIVDSKNFTVDDNGANISGFEAKADYLKKSFKSSKGKTSTFSVGYISGSTTAPYLICLDNGESHYPFAVSDTGVVECNELIAQRITDGDNGIKVGTDYYLVDTSTGKRSLIDSGSSALVIHSNYSLYLLSSMLTQTSNVPLRITANGAVTVSSSARRYKENITTDYDSKINPDNLLEVGVYQFNYKDEFKDKAISINNKELSIMADDIAEKFPCAAIYNKDGTIQSWDERPVISAMLKLIQNLNDEITKLKKEVRNFGGN
ncbi:MAG: tail fiber domain-containing protein [Acetobacter sp.]|nr:tail fiber domain-containing protein [Bacteroides sp.]MCM1342111.1 tail fiber domain-containing protein [Acetobacter sp.]MCM1434330.1 tail fiber domain-containing protein [Clostridiales bacterium]